MTVDFRRKLSTRTLSTLSTITTRHRNSFFPQAIHFMNTWHLTWNRQHTLIFSFQICTCQISHIIDHTFCTLPICIFVYCSFVVCVIVSASDVTPTDRWLNVWCIWYTYLETLQECRSRYRIGWIIQVFQNTCVSCSLTFHLETKRPWHQNPSQKKKAVVFTNVTANAY